MAFAGELATPSYHLLTPVTANSATFTTTETVVLTITAALVSGEVYRVRVKALTESSVASDRVRARLREDSLTGTVMDLQDISLGGASSPMRFTAEEEYTAGATGNKTFVCTLVRQAGTGNVQLTAAATYRAFIVVERIS